MSRPCSRARPSKSRATIGAAGGGDQVAPGDGDRIAAILLVAGEDDLDVGILQGAGRLHGAKGGDHDGHAALVVADSGAFGGVRVLAGETLEGAVRLEHRVEMADEKHPLAAAAALVDGDDVAGPARLRHRHPADREAERLELGPNHLAHRLDSGEVQRAAILVHQPLEQGDRAILLGLDGSDDLLLGGAELRGGGGGEEGEGEEE